MADGDLVIARVKVEFGEVFCFSEVIVEVIDAWNGEVIFDSDII